MEFFCFRNEHAFPPCLLQAHRARIIHRFLVEEKEAWQGLCYAQRCIPFILMVDDLLRSIGLLLRYQIEWKWPKRAEIRTLFLISVGAPFILEHFLNGVYVQHQAFQVLLFNFVINLIFRAVCLWKEPNHRTPSHPSAILGLGDAWRNVPMEISEPRTGPLQHADAQVCRLRHWFASPYWFASRYHTGCTSHISKKQN